MTSQKIAISLQDSNPQEALRKKIELIQTENEKLRRTLKELVYDNDYGMLTRKGFENTLHKFPRNQTLWITAMDICDMRGNNETHGYHKTNRLIKNTYSVLRKSDICARFFSGDEIILITTNYPARALKKLKESAQANGIDFGYNIARTRANENLLNTAFGLFGKGVHSKSINQESTRRIAI